MQYGHPLTANTMIGFHFSPVFAPSELQAVLEGFHCEEYHGLMDGRLLICTVAVGCALFALAWDYFHPFPLSRPILIVCVLSYPFDSRNWNKYAVHVCMLSCNNFLCHMWYKCQSERKDDANDACVIFPCGDTSSKSIFLLAKNVNVVYNIYLIMCVMDVSWRTLKYFLLMGVLTLYTTYTERGIFLYALEKDKAGVDRDNVFKLSSTLKRWVFA